ncbi:MAG TPA: ribonuclease P protein component [Bacteroidales bacterium]|nr:ribonuclease P protein component [Bacteroidales bacterium]
MKATFPKDERLCRRSEIGVLHQQGIPIRIYPFRATWMQTPAMPGLARVRVVMMVSKARFRQAVKRNLLRRRMREAFRLNKHILLDHLPEGAGPIALSISYTAKEILPFDLIQAKIILLLQRLSVENEKVTG